MPLPLDPRWPLAMFLFLSGAAAQVSPAFARLTDGNISSNVTFTGTGSALPDRFLQVHDDVTGSRMIAALSFRPDRFASGQANRITGALSLSNAPAGVSAATPAPTFAGNHGSNQQTYPNLDVTFPAAPYVAGVPLPRPFVYRIPLPSPFASTGVGALVWDLEVQTRPTPQGPMVLDAVTGLTNELRLGVAFGQACRVGASAAVGVHAVAMQPDWTNRSLAVRLDAQNMQAGSGVVFALGLSSAAWMGLPLPLLIPGTDRAPSGSCFVNSSWEVVGFAASASNAGFASVSFSLPIPGASAFNLYTQAIDLVPSVNPLGLVTTNSVHAYLAPPVPTPAPVGSLRQAGSAGQRSPQPHTGFVVRFD